MVVSAASKTRATRRGSHHLNGSGHRLTAGHIEFCVYVCVRAFAFSRMRLSRLRERDMDAFVGRLVHFGLQTPLKSLH